MLLSDARHKMDEGVERVVLAARRVDEAGVEAIDHDGGGDAQAEFGEGIPKLALLLQIQIVEGGHVAAGSDHEVAGSDRVGVGKGNHKLVDIQASSGETPQKVQFSWAILLPSS